MNADVRCETKTLVMSELIEKFDRHEILKPKIQRSACWAYHHTEDKTNCQDFIKFISRNKNLINPLIFVERECDGKNRLFTIDGNNRINAIIHFRNKPFDMFPELIDECFNEPSKEYIKKKDYEFILNHSVSELFEDKKLLESNYNKKYDSEDVFKRYLAMKASIKDMRFMEIKVPITQFQNLNEEELVNIYSSLNRSGVKLTEQDILASTISFIKFGYELSYYNELKGNIVNFYNDINSKEVLKVEFDEQSLNLFEVLKGLQIKIDNDFKNYIPDVKITANTYDLIFTWYNCIFGGFVTIECLQMNEFIEKSLAILRIIQEINFELYGSDINCSSIMSYTIDIPQTFLGALFIYAYRNFDNIVKTRRTLKNCIVYNEICSLLRAGDRKNFYRVHNPIIVASKGKKLRNIKDVDLCEKSLMMNLIDDALLILLKPSATSPKTRRKVNKLYAMLLTSYFNKNMPSLCKRLKNDAEHIIPFSSQRDEPMDIDRLGNLTLLDTNLNKKRSNYRIMDSYIRNNKLEYLLYPNEYRYSQIVNDKNVVLSIREYNLLCIEREKIYIDMFIENLYE